MTAPSVTPVTVTPKDDDQESGVTVTPTSSDCAGGL